MNDISLLLFRESRFPQSTASKFGNWMKQMKVQGRSARAREKREAILMHFSKPPPLRFPLHPRTHKHSSGNTCAVYRDSQVDFSENGKKAKFFFAHLQSQLYPSPVGIRSTPTDRLCRGMKRDLATAVAAGAIYFNPSRRESPFLGSSPSPPLLHFSLLTA